MPAEQSARYFLTAFVTKILILLWRLISNLFVHKKPANLWITLRITWARHARVFLIRAANATA
ncbi:MAG TPA: hypothetical protein DE147_12690 [Gammaproteobacteria bacterium]|nr:hypothetical protein [Gammaproteobacteria bacterium]